MKTWIVSSLDKETIQGEETIQGRKLYEEIRYVVWKLVNREFEILWIAELFSGMAEGQAILVPVVIEGYIRKKVWQL